MAERQREQRFERRMSDAEALMWNVEKDPWLNPSGANVTILDRPIDLPRFRRRMANAVAQVPRLREVVVPGLGRLSPPEWKPDPEFDLDYHLRHLALPPPGDRRQLLDLVSILYQDPFDRTRPLWVFYVIDGLERGHGALFFKLHHSLADGIGAMRLARAVHGSGAPLAHAARGRPRRGDQRVARGCEGGGTGGGQPPGRHHSFGRSHLAPPARRAAPRRRRGRAVGGRPRASPGHGRGRGADGAEGPRPADG